MGGFGGVDMLLFVLRADKVGGYDSVMELFTLVVWLYVGPRFEEVRIEGFDRNACVERLYAIQFARSPAFQSGRSRAKGQCVGANGTIAPREITTPPECASGGCGWDLPNRRRI